MSGTVCRNLDICFKLYNPYSSCERTHSSLRNPQKLGFNHVIENRARKVQSNSNASESFRSNRSMRISAIFPGVDGEENKFSTNTEKESETVDAFKYFSNVQLYLLEETDEEALSRRILSLSRSNKVRSALELYKSMMVMGLNPNKHSCNSLLSSLIRNGFVEDAIEVFKLIEKKGLATGHTYSLVLKAVSMAQGCDFSLQMYRKLEEDTGKIMVISDIILYNTMISICSKAQNWVEAERIWRKIKEEDLKGTLITYRLLITTFVQCGRTELVLDAYREMTVNGLIPGEDTMKALVGAFAKEGEWSLALDIFQKMLDRGLKPNQITYNSLIHCLGKAGELDLAFKVYNLMKSSNHEPDLYTWNALLGALYKANRFGDGLLLFERIQRENPDLNVHIYNMALMCCQKLGLWDQSLQIVWKMEEKGLEVTTASYNHVIGTCEVARKPQIALQIYEHMIHKTCAPDVFTYSSLIRACIWGSLWIEAIEILNHVTPPNASLYNILIQGMCLRGRIKHAKELYMKLRGLGLHPDGKTRALMLQHLPNTSRK